MSIDFEVVPDGERDRVRVSHRNKYEPLFRELLAGKTLRIKGSRSIVTSIGSRFRDHYPHRPFHQRQDEGHFVFWVEDER